MNLCLKPLSPNLFLICIVLENVKSFNLAHLYNNISTSNLLRLQMSFLARLRLRLQNKDLLLLFTIF